MRGHGTFLDNSGERILSSLSGAILQTNKLLRVRPVKSRSEKLTSRTKNIVSGLKIFIILF